MKKRLLSVLLASFLMLSMIPMLASCNSNDNIYELGAYSIKKDEYEYLMGMQKKLTLVNLGAKESQLYDEVLEGVSLGNYMDALYREEFDQSVLTLLFSQIMFDELGLTLSQDKIDYANSLVQSLIDNIGGGIEKIFNKWLSNSGYSFSADTLRRVYLMQYKEAMVLNHLYGENRDKIDEIDIEDCYQNTYMHFQVIIINTLYKKHTDSTGKTTYINLTDDERKYYKQLESELTALLVDEDDSFNYIILKDDKNLSFDELYKKYSDDQFFPQGYYMKKPTSQQFASSDTLATALMLAEGECGVIDAKRYFEGDGSIKTENGEEEIKDGDYFTYGSAFVKKLPLDEKAYDREENKEFFPKESFLKSAAQYTYYKLLSKYEVDNNSTVYASSDKNGYTYFTIKANELDYYLFYGNN